MSAMLLVIAATGLQAASEAQPANSPARWITQDDYPSAARSARQQGDAAFRLDVDGRGRVAACVITASTGSPILDETTCNLLKRRARFRPARDATGANIAGAWSGVFRWRPD